MIEIQMVYWWAAFRLQALRDNRDQRGDDGFTVLEWVAGAAIVIAAAIVITTVLMNKGKSKANTTNLQ